MAEALEVRELSVRLGQRDVLERVSLRARAGELTAVLGPNGAGKSTLLRAVCGLIPYRGEIHLDGEPLDALDARQRATRLSFVPQQTKLTSALPVRLVVAQGRYAHRDALSRLGARDREAIDAALAESDVAELAERPFTELSVGEQRRVLIARALATGARTLLLDEPSAALDIEHALRLFALLGRLATQGRCVVAVLHQLDEAIKFSNSAVLLARGALVASGPSSEIISAERVRDLYGVELVEGGGLGFRLPEARAR